MATQEQASVVLILFGAGEVAMIDLDSITEIIDHPRLSPAPNHDA